MLSQPLAPDASVDYFDMESVVRSYCRRMPSVYSRAINAEIWDEDGNRHIDFLSSCGSVNYGHNNPFLKARLIQYIAADGITNSMDLRTSAKRLFLKSLQENILSPRGLDYRVQFPGPTGTNAVEAALKLARKITGRQTVVAFSNGFHGMTLGALAATGNAAARRAAGIPLSHIHRLPFEGFAGAGVEEIQTYERLVTNNSGGMEPPAAFIVETVQAEGGLNIASISWLLELAAVAKRLGALIIVDDIQAGCGRTGDFFSFERANLKPDIVCLSKSIGGFGLPFAIVLLKPDLDIWAPGEHNGTFRGNNLAFVTAAAALELWRDQRFVTSIHEKSQSIFKWIKTVENKMEGRVTGCGLGLMQGLKFASPRISSQVAAQAVTKRLLIETCGADGEVVKIMPPLTIEDEVLREGLIRLDEALEDVMRSGILNLTTTSRPRIPVQTSKEIGRAASMS
jgi:diaminobutyrate-2-oxoglutarate transaminase